MSLVLVFQNWLLLTVFEALSQQLKVSAAVGTGLVVAGLLVPTRILSKHLAAAT